MHVYGISRPHWIIKRLCKECCQAYFWVEISFVQTHPGDCDGIHRFQVDARITALSRPSKVIYDVKVAVIYIHEINKNPILCEIGQTSR